MRFVIIGAGAIGGVIGGQLFEHGHDVQFVARGAHYESIRANGLQLETPGASSILRIPVVSHVRELTFRPDDVVFLAVKSQDTIGVLNDLVAVAPVKTPILCFQNGVWNEPTVMRSFSNVYGVVTVVPAFHLVPGVVGAGSAPLTGVLDIGRYPLGVDGVANEVAAALQASTFDCVTRENVMRWKYTKLLNNLHNAVDATCGAQARKGPIGIRATEEGVACLKAADIDFAGPDEAAGRRVHLLNMQAIGDDAWRAGSTWQSLARGTGSVETDYLNGEIALLGRLHDIKTPINAALQYFTAAMSRDHLSPGSMTEAEFLLAADA